MSVLGGFHLTVLSCKVGNAAHDPTRSVVRTGRDEQLKPSEITVEPSTTDETFPPLKSILGSLSAILDHCDVHFISNPNPPMTLTAVPANDGVSQNNRIIDASS